MRQRRTIILAAVVLSLGIAFAYGARSFTATAGAAENGLVPGTASVSGTVEAAAPFKAAQVHLLNTDKNVLFMVYTSGGRYRAVNLFPGRYEVSVRKAGFAADPRTVTVAAGATETVTFSLREAPIVPLRQGEFGFTTQRVGEVPLVSYD